MVKPITTISVVPNLPEPLARMRELAYNLRWAWDHESIALFRRLDRDLWNKTGHNPVQILGSLSQKQLEDAANDPAFMAHFNRVCEDFDAYMNETNTWYNTHYADVETPTMAYFSMEFGITESIQNYSGGLGVLSGDHLKSASDLGLPLVGMGLLYQEGYFRQYLNVDGYQQESYPINDWANLPVTLERDKDGKPLLVTVPMPGRELKAQIWRMQVGRIPLYLLDSNISANPLVEDRNLTDRLYGGDRRKRIRQEILMGIGGIRALEALNKRPNLVHMNEGHSAFLALERIRQMMNEQDLTFQQAREILAASHVFTTHTPVPAGLERFGFDLIDEHFSDYFGELGLDREQFIDLGREKIDDYELFSMPVLALKLSSMSNGVAALHGEVSRRMWQWVYPYVPQPEVPIGSVTNGIHVMTWISNDMKTLLDRYLVPDWLERISDPDVWKDVETIPDSELWRTHERRRERTVAFSRRHLRQHLERRGAAPSELKAADEVLNPDVLTIGFARRFATYKRATLLFRDVERLISIVNNPDRPIQLLFAGKAHPHDTGGKEMIRQIVNIARMPELRHAIVFLEDYDMTVTRMMVQGVDVWLNNPRRPKEASGTSGMKCIYNGGLNCSIIDGWWAEGYTPEVGWAIGSGEEYPEHEWEHQDYIESEALYNILEQDIAPLFYDRGRDGLPREWIAMVKASMAQLGHFFNTRRMVEEYTTDYYMPSYANYRKMTVPDLKPGLTYAAWRADIEESWSGVSVQEVKVSEDLVRVDSDFEVEAVVKLGHLKPEDVRVQLYYGKVNPDGQIGSGRAVDMNASPSKGTNGDYKFTAQVKHESSGELGISVRVLPHHDFLPTDFLPNMIVWAH